MKRLQKIFFALSAIAGIMIGCKAPQEVIKNLVPENPALVGVAVTENDKTTPASLANKTFTAEVKTTNPAITVTAPEGAEVVIGGVKTKSTTAVFNEAEKIAKKKEITIKISIGSSVNDTYTLVLNYTGNEGGGSPSTPEEPNTTIKTLTVVGENGTASTVPAPVNNVYTVMVTEKTFIVKVEAASSSASVFIDGARKYGTKLTLGDTENEKNVKIDIEHKGKKASYTVKIRYDASQNVGIKTVTVTEQGASSRQLPFLNGQYQGTVTHNETDVTVTPEVSSAQVFFLTEQGTEPAASNNTKHLTFSHTAEPQTITVRVKQGTVHKDYTIVVTYAQYNLDIASITVTDAAGSISYTEDKEKPRTWTVKNQEITYTVETTSSAAEVLLVKNGGTEEKLTEKKGTVDLRSIKKQTVYIKITEGGQKSSAIPLTFNYTAPDLRINAIEVNTKTAKKQTADSFHAEIAKNEALVKIIQPKQAGSITGVDSNITVKIDNELYNPVTAKTITFTEEGQKMIPIVVEGYGKSKEYTLRLVYKNPALALKNITVTSGTAPVDVVAFPPAAYKAVITEATCTVEVEAGNSAAAVKINNGTQNPATVSITQVDQPQNIPIVISHEGVEKTYTLTIIRTASQQQNIEAKLTKLTVENSNSELPLIPGFDSNTKNYTVNAAADIASVTVEAEAAAGLTIEGAQTHQLSSKTTTIKVTVYQTTKPTNKALYTITVNKAEQGATANAFLKSLQITALKDELSGPYFKWNTPFQKETESYTYDTLADVDGFEVKATAEDSKATITLIQDNKPEVSLKNGKNFEVKNARSLQSLKIKVVSPDTQVTKTYTVTITRIAVSKELSALSGEGLKNFIFNKAEHTYNVTIDPTKNSTQITATAETPNTVKIQYAVTAGTAPQESEYHDCTSGTPFDVQLSTDTTKVFIRLVSTISGYTFPYGNEYYLTINKLTSQSNNADLKSLNLLYGTGKNTYSVKMDKDFDPNTTNYTVKLPANATELSILTACAHTDASIEGWNGATTNYYNLSNLPTNNQILIKVVAGNGSEKTYTLTVQKQQPVTLTVIYPTVNQSLNANENGTVTVTGTYEDTADIVGEIWIGSTALPIQQSLGSFWTKATLGTNGSKTFSGTFDITKLGKGSREIAVMAFMTDGRTPLAITTVPVTIINDVITTVTGTVEAKADASFIPSSQKYNVTIKVYDVEYAAAFENVIVYQKTFENVNGSDFTSSFGYYQDLSNIMSRQDKTFKALVKVTELGSNTVVASGESEAMLLTTGVQFKVTLKAVK